MDMYRYCLAALTLANVVALQLLQRQSAKSAVSFWTSQTSAGQSAAVSRLRYRFLVVYVLVVAADWLQGSFFYVVYREGHGLPEATVGKLSAAGFAAGAIAATFVGSLADSYGRKKACLAYCLISAVSCLCVLVRDIRVLFAGRVLGGVGTTLLFSVFEPWLLGELDHLCSDTAARDDAASNIFALMAIINGSVSIASGVFSEYLVQVTGTTKSPFAASAVLLMLAARLIVRDWSDNYGVCSTNLHKSFLDNVQTLRTVWDSRVLRLSAVSFSFESTIYIVVYFWPSAISSARSGSSVTSPPPFGLIFANLMSAMMLGSTTFRLLSSMRTWVFSLRDVSRYLLLVAAVSLLTIALSGSEAVCFASLCLFEACVGVYSPVMASLKGQEVLDEHRSKVYGFLRVPTNLYIVLALLSVKTGDTYRSTSLIVSSVLLILGSAASAFGSADKIVDMIDPV